MSQDVSTYTEEHPAVVASLQAISAAKNSWEAAREECYAWQRVRDALDPNETSNIGHRHITWSTRRPGAKTGRYCMSMHHPIVGHVGWSTSAPLTLEEARTDPRLLKAVARRDATLQGLLERHGPSPVVLKNVTAEVEKVLRATTAGRLFLSERATSKLKRILVLIRTADSYAYEDWSSASPREAHIALRTHRDRVCLVAAGIMTDEAKDVARVRLRSTETPSPFRPIELPARLKSELRRAARNGCTLTDIKREWQIVQAEISNAVVVAA